MPKLFKQSQASSFSGFASSKSKTFDNRKYDGGSGTKTSRSPYMKHVARNEFEYGLDPATTMTRVFN